MPLFNPKIVHSVIETAKEFQTEAVRNAAADWAARASDPGLDLQNESQLEQEFNRIIVQDVLGYVGQRAGHPFRSEAVERDAFLTAMIESFHGKLDALVDELERMLA